MRMMARDQISEKQAQLKKEKRRRDGMMLDFEDETMEKFWRVYPTDDGNLMCLYDWILEEGKHQEKTIVVKRQVQKLALIRNPITPDRIFKESSIGQWNLSKRKANSLASRLDKTQTNEYSKL